MTNRLTYLFCATVTLLSLNPYGAEAANFRFLKDSVLTRFSKVEAAEFRTFIGDALDSAQDKQILQWQSKQSKLTGKLKIDFSYLSGKTPCRRSLFIISDIEGKAENFQFDICKSGNTWKVDDTVARHLADSDLTLLRQAGEQALSHKATGEPFSWHNTRSRNSGVVIAVAEDYSHKPHSECRQLALTIFDKNGRSSNGVYWMCRKAGGEWLRQVRDEDFSLPANNQQQTVRSAPTKP